jgi:thiol-disulfide isomerase/thioredoxin
LIGHEGAAVALIGRRGVLAIGASLLAGLGAGKCQADDAAGGDFRPLSDIVKVPAEAMPDLAFTTLDGAPVTLASFRGKPVVLNFWATWCAPCVAELPELDKLAAGGAVTVLVVSTDRTGAARVKPFLVQHKITHAQVLLDPGSDAAHAAKVVGFPTTLILDGAGKLRGRLEGPAAWGTAAPTIAKLVS